MKPNHNLSHDKESALAEGARRRIDADIRHREKISVDQFRNVVDQLSVC
jgi:hypothetical protein